ncbi:hypothetical protein V5R04_14675 [Jonesiaceae bacterium BS-20]|uniref:Uncharacterized protein n=1 Tax=Jonesiaceae bacterium BS-20 TaxID=3120821 RepID=A0AAU7DXI1_9MICO
MAALDRSGNNAQSLDLHELRQAIYKLSAADIPGADGLGKLTDHVSEEIAKARQSLINASAALSQYQTNHVVNADGRIGSTFTVTRVGQAAAGVAAALAAAGMAKTGQLGAKFAQRRNESSDSETRALLAREFEEARAESLEKNGDVRRELRQLRALFAQALYKFFQKHGPKIEGVLKVAGLAIGVGALFSVGTTAMIGLAPFYLAAAKFAVQMAKYEAEHGFKNDGKTYLMASKEVFKLALAVDSGALSHFKIGDADTPIQINAVAKAWTKAAVAAADYAWKIIELHNQRGFRSGGKTYLTATKETFTAAFAVSAPLIGEKIPVTVAKAACTVFFKIVEQRPVGGFWWKKDKFFKTVTKEVLKGSIGEFLKFNATSKDNDTKTHPEEGVIQNISFKHLNSAWELGSDKIPDSYAHFKKHSKAFERMVEYVSTEWEQHRPYS